MKMLSPALLAVTCVVLITFLSTWFLSEAERSAPISSPDQIGNPLSGEWRPETDSLQISNLAVFMDHEEHVAEGAVDEKYAEAPLEAKTMVLDPQAIESMSNARVHGDPRSPNISRAKLRELPSSEELEYPELYIDYQARKRQKGFADFVMAAGPKIDQLNELIQEGVARGISIEELEQGREKVRRLEEMVKQLKEENPEIVELLNEN